MRCKNLESNPVCLVGLIKSGKTTIGQYISNYCNIRFIDTDKEIEKREGISTSVIIENKGIQFFREKEEEIVNDILMQNNYNIIALGGGTWLSPKIRRIVKLHNVTSLWLDVCPYVLANREGFRKLLSSNSLTEEQILEKMYKKRVHLYKKAKLTIKIRQEEKPQETAIRIINLLIKSPQ